MSGVCSSEVLYLVPRYSSNTLRPRTQPNLERNHLVLQLVAAVGSQDFPDRFCHRRPSPSTSVPVFPPADVVCKLFSPASPICRQVFLLSSFSKLLLSSLPSAEFQSSHLPVFQSSCLPVVPSSSLPVFLSFSLPAFHSSSLPVLRSSCRPAFQPSSPPVFLPSSLPAFQSSSLLAFQPSSLPVQVPVFQSLRLRTVPTLALLDFSNSRLPVVPRTLPVSRTPPLLCLPSSRCAPARRLTVSQRKSFHFYLSSLYVYFFLQFCSISLL